MRTGRSEALDIFRRWFSERTLLICNFSFHDFAVALRGRIIALSEDEVKILSDDTFSETAIRIAPELEFGYGEPTPSSEEAELYESGLVLYFSPVPPEGEPDYIALTEVKIAGV